MTFRRLALLALAVALGQVSTSHAQIILPRPINGSSNTLSPSSNRPIGPARPSSPTFNNGYNGQQFLPQNQRPTGDGTFQTLPINQQTPGNSALGQVQVVVTGIVLTSDSPPKAPPATIIAARPNLAYPATTQAVLTLDNGTRVIINAGTRLLVDPNPLNASRAFVRGLARADGSVVATYVQIY